MSAHTPGPWKVDSSGYKVVSSNSNIDGGKVASCSSYDNASSAPANARLIAAAPELLETLEAFVRVTESGIEGGMIHMGIPEMRMDAECRIMDVREKARTIIAKAR